MFVLDTNVVSELMLDRPHRGGTLVTRNVRDFDGIEIAVVNPWKSP